MIDHLFSTENTWLVTAFSAGGMSTMGKAVELEEIRLYMRAKDKG